MAALICNKANVMEWAKEFPSVRLFLTDGLLCNEPKY